MKSIAIIPARGGSKRIPRKNIKDFLGKPIIAYSIEAALDSGIFDEVMVSTDDEEIAEVARKYGASVPFMRSSETSNDYAGTEEVITEVINNYIGRGVVFDNICCLYATAPFITPVRLKEGIKKLNDSFDASFTIVKYSYPIQRSLEITDEGHVIMKYPEYLDYRTQDLNPIYHDAGQFYFVKANVFLKERTLWCKRTTPIILSELEVQDLDTLTDWKLAELKYRLLISNEKSIF